MSDLGFTLAQTTALHTSTVRPRVSLVEALGQPVGFRPSARFGGAPGLPLSHRELAIADPDLHDPLADAYARGYAEGHVQASEEAQARAAAIDAARDALSLSFARLDAVMEEDLRLRLRDTVGALCEAALAPLAIDEVALVRRIERAVGMLAAPSRHRPRFGAPFRRLACRPRCQARTRHRARRRHHGRRRGRPGKLAHGDSRSAAPGVR
jgi:flagellar assembly protein FliH